MQSKAKALKNKIIDKTSSVMAAPVVGYHKLRGAVADQQFKSRRAKRNFKNRTDNTNYYKGRDYWSKNTN